MKQPQLAILTLLMPLAFLESSMAGPNCPPRYTVSYVPGPWCGVPFGHGFAQGFGGNDLGTMIGLYSCPGGFDNAFVSYDGTTLTPLEMPGGTYLSRAFAVNDANQIGGEFENSDGRRAFLIDGSTFIDLGFLPGGTMSNFGDLNADGTVVGNANNVSPPYLRAFRWSNGMMEDLSVDLPLKGGSIARAISNSGLITGSMGYTASPQNTHAFIWDDGRVTDLGLPFPECFATEGWDITNEGHVCGLWWKPIDENPGYARRGFFYDGETFTDLGDVPGGGLDVYATSLNESGQVVGYSGNVGFIWQDGTAYKLTDLVIQGPTTVFVKNAHHITDEGRIYGDAVVVVAGSGQSVAVRLTPAPPRPGDVTCDSSVNVVLAVINGWGLCEPGESCTPDLNIDGVVNYEDLMTVIIDFDQ